MKIAICDYPSPHLFPPIGYGGIERWLYACAVGAELCKYNVVLIGNQWQKPLFKRFNLIRHRIEFEDFKTEMYFTDKFDLLVCGHEYFDNELWSRKASLISNKVVTFQHGNYQYKFNKFYNDNFHLHCYSQEMLEIYSQYGPLKSLASGAGLDESPFPATPEKYFLWMGRIDEEKSPHIAIHTVQKLKGYTLIIAGPIKDSEYFNKNIAPYLRSTRIKYIGEVSGRVKSLLIANAKAFIYTKSESYIEPGALVFSEVLKFGVPILALSWSGRDCAIEAICQYTGRCVVGKFDNLNSLTDALADMATEVLRLKRGVVAEIASNRFCLKKQINHLLFD